MKTKSIRLLLSFQILFTSLFPLSCQEINLSDNLKAGRDNIEQIINKYSLSDSLSSCSYLGYWTGNSWIIVCDKYPCYIAYYGRFNDNNLYTQRVHRDNQDMNILFGLTTADFEYTDLDYSNSSWYYHYFVLFDASHSHYLECNSNMMRRTRKGKKQKLMPLLPSSIVVLWRIMMPGLFSTEEIVNKTDTIL